METIPGKYFEIALCGLHFRSFHGVLPQETKTGNDFEVDVSVRIPFEAEAADDNLDATVNYADLYAIISDEMGKPRKLMESVAAAMAERISERFPGILNGSITICKSTPPIAGITGSAKITLFF